jgi:hypothetical protein
MSFSGFSAIVAIFILLAIPIAIATLIAGRTSRFAHRKKQLIQNVIIAEYDPPDKLTPAELGYLFDSRVNSTEIAATLVSMEQLGLVTLSFSALDGMHVQTTSSGLPEGLKEHELYLLSNLKADTNLSLFSLKIIHGFKAAIIKSLRTQGYIKSQRETVNYYAQRTVIAYLLITIIIFLWLISGADRSLSTAIGAFIFVFVIGFPFFLGLALIAGMIYNNLVGQPGIWTDKLKSIWKDVEGYRDFIEQVELDELQFESEDLKILFAT